jgi:hypothetical protein
LADKFSVLWLLAYFGLKLCLNFLLPLDSEVLECKAGKVIRLQSLRVMFMLFLLDQLVGFGALAHFRWGPAHPSLIFFFRMGCVFSRPTPSWLSPGRPTCSIACRKTRLID